MGGPREHELKLGKIKQGIRGLQCSVYLNGHYSGEFYPANVARDELCDDKKFTLVSLEEISSEDPNSSTVDGGT